MHGLTPSLTAIGKKNWLFMGSADAGQTGAILFTIVECCRRRGIDPFEYLWDVLDRIPSMTNQQIGELVPEAWAQSRRPAWLRLPEIIDVIGRAYGVYDL